MRTGFEYLCVGGGPKNGEMVPLESGVTLYRVRTDGGIWHTYRVTSSDMGQVLSYVGPFRKEVQRAPAERVS